MYLHPKGHKAIDNPLIPVKINSCLINKSSNPTKINDEIAPDPKIKVGIKSGKIIRGINKLCCFKDKVSEDPKIPIKLKAGVPKIREKIK